LNRLARQEKQQALQKHTKQKQTQKKSAPVLAARPRVRVVQMDAKQLPGPQQHRRALRRVLARLQCVADVERGAKVVAADLLVVLSLFVRVCKGGGV
jgi:hypothetical protein